MSDIGIDEVLDRLSAKFNRIIYDRDFVGCVSEDLRAVINNKNKCCVLVFPTLSPNYLRLVRYQAKLCDLAVISLSSGSAKSIGVCHRKYLLRTTSEEDLKKENNYNTSMAETATNVTRKKRPPIQLYVPPAQRKSRLNTANTIHKVLIRQENKCRSSERRSLSASKENPNFSVFQTRDDLSIETSKIDKSQSQEVICYCVDDIEFFTYKKDLNICYPCDCINFFLFKDILPYAILFIFSIKRMKHSFHWIGCCKEDPKMLTVEKKYENWSIIDRGRNILKANFSNLRSSLFEPSILDFRESQSSQEDQCEFQNKYYLCGDKVYNYLPNFRYYSYLSVPDYEIFDDGLNLDYYLHLFEDTENRSLHIQEYIKSLNNSILLPQISKKDDITLEDLLVEINRTESPKMPLQNDISKCDSINHISAKQEAKSIIPEKKHVAKQIDRVIVLDERIEPVKIGPKSSPIKEIKSKQNEHEQEKEIMRKAKQNINRKTRPIIKYVDDDNDTLRIGKADNVNNWEDLFNDDGELQEDIFTEIVQKVGPEVSIVKATEDYSAYASKQIEELEHLVELYDFPATLETHDIISAFSSLNSDSMYVKWLDDTHALLVLGSSTQAQKAIELSNPLIKVRPMSAASSIALKKANQFDLKPAMKRPQTNLQTARRLITSHLGAKSKVTKEQSAKEREDLRLAKELKKKAKQNERDAWEGNLRSTIN